MIVLSALLIGTVSVLAASPVRTTGPFEGEFSGYISGDKGSRAPIALDLTHRSDEVKGYIELGEGLYIDGGVCGGGYLPSTTQYAGVESDSRNPRKITEHLVFKVSGIKIPADLNGEISADGEAISAEARIDLPWFCGRDPQLKATLFRDENSK
jgi:hypothetical protein